MSVTGGVGNVPMVRTVRLATERRNSDSDIGMPYGTNACGLSITTQVQNNARNASGPLSDLHKMVQREPHFGAESDCEARHRLALCLNRQSVLALLTRAQYYEDESFVNHRGSMETH